MESYWWNSLSQWYDGFSEISDFGIASGKISDFIEFQSWKINFRTEVCLRTADPHLTVHWIKLRWQIQLTKYDIVGRDDFPDFDVLDAMIASALKKLLNTHVHSE